MPTAITTEDVAALHMSYTQLMTDCWSRGLSYADYQHFALKFAKHCVPEQSYKLHCQAMDLDMEHNIGVEQANEIPVEDLDCVEAPAGTPYIDGEFLMVDLGKPQTCVLTETVPVDPEAKYPNGLMF